MVVLKRDFQMARVSLDLSDAVPPRDGCEDRFEKRSADDFNPTAIDELLDPVDVLGMVEFQPLQQTAGYVQ